MALTDQTIRTAEIRSLDLQKTYGRIVSARYDRRTARVFLELDNGLGLSFAAEAAEGLAEATHAARSQIEISPTGLGLHWPQLDADLYLPGLLAGVFGSQSWMASQLGREGGKARSPEKAAAARENGKRGGRPRKSAA